MNRIPSLDLMNGKVVRLQKGDFEKVTVYFDDPRDCIKALKRDGATCIHIVDLDQTRKGAGEKEDSEVTRGLPITPNYEAINQIILENRGNITLQLGGGIRSYETAQFWLEKGIDRVVVGTLFFSDYESYARLVRDYPGQIVLALDVKHDEVCHTGWQVGSGTSIDSVIESGKIGDVHSLLVTDISTDGMLTGPNLELLKRLVQLRDYRLIASGGISSDADCAAIQELEIPYAIIGKAYYEGRITKLGEIF
ncbi:MAG TPA: 1-(5-phosphoribosyl)-5-[(5-phosphoribosylamino)methylideneamino] imidazole-4-carboxamide isomerase [Fusibacter sp.]|nr:1-(5-phosphoribosyl)-5-[(5-phosphoribosylamino)methylideneamino] imidazole-4-carboxamide isomerase [Fusibacter sp.]